MPTYDYECPQCGVIEIFHSMKETRETCPHCNQPIKKILSSGSGVLFKGTGFYQTDYRSNSYKEGQKKETPTTSSDSKKDSSKPKSTPDKS